MTEGSSYPENGKLQKGKSVCAKLSQKAGSNQVLLQTKRFKALPSRMLGEGRCSRFSIFEAHGEDHCSNSNAIVKSSITSFEDHERRSVHANVHTERSSVIVDSVSAIVIRSLIIEQHQSSDDSAETEKQK
jgi:hypothetical protein